MTAPLHALFPLVFVDTNALYPVRLADLILSSVDDGMFDLCVSDHLLDEVQRVLVEKKKLPLAKAKEFRDAVEGNAVCKMRTAQYEPLAQKLNGPDVDDLYHLAAAIEAGADFIVTHNIRDFITVQVPANGNTPRIVTPDEFFLDLLAGGLEEDIVNTVHRISDKYSNPYKTPSQILNDLEQIGLIDTVDLLRKYQQTVS